MPAVVYVPRHTQLAAQEKGLCGESAYGKGKQRLRPNTISKYTCQHSGCPSWPVKNGLLPVVGSSTSEPARVEGAHIVCALLVCVIAQNQVVAVSRQAVGNAKADPPRSCTVNTRASGATYKDCKYIVHYCTTSLPHMRAGRCLECTNR